MIVRPANRQPLLPLKLYDVGPNTGTEMFEFADIIAYLEKQYAR